MAYPLYHRYSFSSTNLHLCWLSVTFYDPSELAWEGEEWLESPMAPSNHWISNVNFKPFFKGNVNSLSSSYMWSLPSRENWSIVVTEYFPGGYSSMTVLFRIVKVIWYTKNNLLSKFSWLKRVNESSESWLYVNV